MVDLSIVILNYPRVNPIKYQKNTIFQWFSNGFSMVYQPSKIDLYKPLLRLKHILFYTFPGMTSDQEIIVVDDGSDPPLEELFQKDEKRLDQD